MTDNGYENQEQMNGNTILANGALGYDFFNNFTVVVDRLGGKMTFVKKSLIREFAEDCNLKYSEFVQK